MDYILESEERKERGEGIKGVEKVDEGWRESEGERER